MRYFSVCSGIESASVALAALAWTPVAFAEIESFACAVLAHHYPEVPNLGDINEFRDWPAAAFDVLIGGTPCQSFSVAGLRTGLADPRGNLALVYLAIAERYRPRWLVWENVPGVLSQNDGRDFGAILAGLVELGYGFAYRVLDAQYVRVDGFCRAVPQRRRRVFVVGHLGNWRGAAAVLFERESLCWDYPPRRTARQAIATTLDARADAGGAGRGSDFLVDGGLIPVDVPDIVSQAVSSKWFKSSSGPSGDEAINLIAVADPICANEQRTYTHEGEHNFRLRNVVPVAFAENSRAEFRLENGDGSATGSLKCEGGKPGQSYPVIHQGLKVRRLSPRECERLQGFPDDYTLIPYRGKPARDGPRYRAIGNAMACNVMRWIGQRIEMVEESRCLKIQMTS
jgi:DNA (cytosine-5)-methyltransferase 1